MSVAPHLPSPASVPAGHIVRIRLGGHCYHSAFMPPSEAAALADHLEHELANLSAGTSFVKFAAADGRTIKVRARAVSAVEHGPPPEYWNRKLDAGLPLELDPDAPVPFTVVNNVMQGGPPAPGDLRLGPSRRA